jgi:hypothetical protein
MVTQLKTGSIIPPKAPNLPIGPVEYSQQFTDQYSNVLRLYFNQIDNFAQPFTQQNGGSYLRFPFIAAEDTASQYATGSNIPTICIWNTLSNGSGFTLNANSTATAEFAGIYKITYSLQLANNDNAAHDAIVWLRTNGSNSAADINNSTTIFTVPARKSAGVPTYVAGYSECVFPLNAGDNVGLWWGATQAATANASASGVYIYSTGAQTTPMTYPAVPSAIGSITFVSALTT